MTVRIATYNLFEGASGSYNRLVEFVRDAQLDVVCFQEVNGWQDGDNARLRDFTDKVLFTASAYGNSNTEFKLATISKHAIVGKTLHAEAFWHAALETVVQATPDKQIAVMNVHLDPWQEASRVKEVKRLLAAVQAGRPTIITGDFNSLSRQDNYPPELLQQLQAKGISKFGANALEFSVIDCLLQAGFIDVAAAAGKMETTVPSDFNTDQAHEVPVRVDYVFVSPDLVPCVRGVETLKNDLTNAISDHYPVVLTLDFDGPAAAPAVAQQMPAAAPYPQPTAPAQAAAPEPPRPSYQEYREPVKPWTPDPLPDAPEPGQMPPEPPKPKDGEVTLWTHDSDQNG
jgi:exodeoxyribonuclease-3